MPSRDKYADKDLCEMSVAEQVRFAHELVDSYRKSDANDFFTRVWCDPVTKSHVIDGYVSAHALEYVSKLIKETLHDDVIQLLTKYPNLDELSPETQVYIEPGEIVYEYSHDPKWVELDNITAHMLELFDEALNRQEQYESAMRTLKPYISNYDGDGVQPAKPVGRLLDSVKVQFKP